MRNKAKRPVGRPSRKPDTELLQFMLEKYKACTGSRGYLCKWREDQYKIQGRGGAYHRSVLKTDWSAIQQAEGYGDSADTVRYP